MGHHEPMKIVIIKKCPKLLKIYGKAITDSNHNDLYIKFIGIFCPCKSVNISVDVYFKMLSLCCLDGGSASRSARCLDNVLSLSISSAATFPDHVFLCITENREKICPVESRLRQKHRFSSMDTLTICSKSRSNRN